MLWSFLRKVKATQAELLKCQQDKQALESSLAALSDSLCLVEFSPEGDILSANASYLEMMGYQANELLGKNHSVLCLKKDVLANEYTQFWRRLREGETVKGMNLRLTRNKQEIYIGGTYCPVLDSHGKVSRILKIASDITRRIKENAEMDGIFAAVNRSMVVVEYNPAGEVIKASDNFLSAMGYSPQDAIGLSHKVFCQSNYVQSGEYRSFWSRLVGGEYISGKYPRVSKTGQQVWLEGTYNPIYDNRKQLVKIVEFATDITSSVTQAQQTNELAFESTKRTDSISSNGIEIANQAMKSMQDVSLGLNAAAKDINALNEQSEQISNIVNTISAIADQTNLLALNAAIEAARAGEQGRGFAVVADEVRQLAGRTSKSTAEIGAVVKLNNEFASNAVKSIEKIVIDAQHSVELVEQTGDTIKKINQSTKEMVDVISQMTKN
ncbi:methyl-accepting chemotaxis protein [Paraglaciecola hydrolytica]|uniref:Chemotaxis protein n=1 Tax=Paraglaciecola hydrolytica TaxID=1799789 RepID=A0A148KMT8_9ALTE|nr:PAS domain-containing methyl-accepting chemotaxis protein [Paraglaciecola hydrolytica]KXI27622.1 hypothetical protein AX660_18865 [Paraglaciecola hydrolytica]